MLQFSIHSNDSLKAIENAFFAFKKPRVSTVNNKISEYSLVEFDKENSTVTFKLIDNIEDAFGILVIKDCSFSQNGSFLVNVKKFYDYMKQVTTIHYDELKKGLFLSENYYLSSKEDADVKKDFINTFNKVHWESLNDVPVQSIPIDKRQINNSLRYIRENLLTKVLNYFCIHRGFNNTSLIACDGAEFNRTILTDNNNDFSIVSKDYMIHLENLKKFKNFENIIINLYDNEFMKVSVKANTDNYSYVVCQNDNIDKYLNYDNLLSHTYEHEIIFNKKDIFHSISRLKKKNCKITKMTLSKSTIKFYFKDYGESEAQIFLAKINNHYSINSDEKFSVFFKSDCLFNALKAIQSDDDLIKMFVSSDNNKPVVFSKAENPTSRINLNNDIHLFSTIKKEYT